jgi:hypothetical protein
MAKERFFTNARRAFLGKVIVNLITVMAAATLASKFFAEFPTAVKIAMACAIPLLIIVGIVTCPPEEPRG